MIKQILIAAVSIILPGCIATVPIDTQFAEIMPTAVAHQILERRLGRDWATDPYVVKVGSCGTSKERVRVKFNEIKKIRYNSTLSILFIHRDLPILTLFYGCLQVMEFHRMDKSDAAEVTTALRALGACTAKESDC